MTSKKNAPETVAKTAEPAALKPAALGPAVPPPSASIDDINTYARTHTAAGEVFDPREESAKAMFIAQRQLEVFERADALRVGDWYGRPPGCEDWHIIRCGKRNDSNAQALAQQMVQWGYRPMPRSVGMVGMEVHEKSEDAIILGTPRENHERIRAAKAAKARRMKEQILADHMSQDELRRIVGGRGSVDVGEITQQRVLVPNARR